MIDGGLRATFRKYLPQVFWQSIETGSTGRGIPDSHYLYPNGCSGWIEFKRAQANAVDVRAEQIAWIERYKRNNGNAFVAVRVQGAVFTDDLFIVDGAEVRALYSFGLAGVSPLLWTSGGPRNWDWAKVNKILCHFPHKKRL